MSDVTGLKLIFLDRDGVINQFPGIGNYVTRWEDFHFLPRAAEAIALLSKAGYEVNVISNQGCVSRGDLTLEDLQKITGQMLKAVEKIGGKIHGVFYCPHQTNDHCDCKKPKTRLFQDALHGRSVTLKGIYFVGDSVEDMEAAQNLGCGKLLVLSGRNGPADVERFSVKPDVIKKDLWEAASWILQQKF